MFRVGSLGLLALLLVTQSFAQNNDAVESSARCVPVPGADVCLLAAAGDDPPAPEEAEPEYSSSAATKLAVALPESDAAAEPIEVVAQPRQGFQWGAALAQAARLTAFQQGMLLATDRWGRYSVANGKFFADYANAVKGTFTQWDDGDPFLDNYIGHPLQGAVTGFIQVQNDPQGRALTITNSKAYWKSRMKAMAWTAAVSTQFEVGPVSEASIQNLGGFLYQNCPTCPPTRGAGWVDIVVTPTLGTAWLVGEDALDRFVVHRIENKIGRGKWANFFRCALNPGRTAANLIRLKAPWYRDNRDTPQLLAVAQ